MRVRGSDVAMAVAMALTCAVAGCGQPAPRSVGAPAASSPGSTPSTPPPTGGPSPSVDATRTATAGPDPASDAATVAGDGSGRAAAGAGAPAEGGGAPDRAIDTDTTCTPSTLQAASQALLGGVRIARVEVFACRNSYARLTAVPAGSPDTLPEPQIFLKRSGAQWQLAGRAAANIDCGDGGLAPAISTACGALAG
ncbi:hypothetical protein KBX53_32290 [Micromonospora sp. M51]|uniref:Uncharacterized protein n=1 Tax=Micromonospora parva TaxID=1464048 RepID=A0ABW6W1D5_9ACTN|nr:hypothetical protein [Micromonospora sp. M51]MBQ1015527.1 hypothetical protein [Micromonospora sp. M51]